MRKFFAVLLLLSTVSFANASAPKPRFRVVAFFTGKNDLAHISFVGEANRWFAKAGQERGFSYDTTSNWNNMNAAFLAKYEVVLFLDTRPEKPEQRAAFQKFMENGGRWMGFHFSAFALTPSAYPQDWDWYHNEFLGSGQYASNTWQPTTAFLRVEKPGHPVTEGISSVMKSAPNEWYRWEKDLTKNPDIEILMSIDSTSFPLGTGPKPEEIWHSGYYPVVWTNKKYRMIYVNMGHNDMDYARGTNRALSSTFGSIQQNWLFVNALLWLGK